MYISLFQEQMYRNKEDSTMETQLKGEGVWIISGRPIVKHTVLPSQGRHFRFSVEFEGVFDTPINQ